MTRHFEPGSKGIFATPGAGLAFGTRRRVGTKSAAARAKVEAQKASLAEHVAEGGSITGWGRANSVSDGRVWQLWAKIRADLGGQAR